jgi:hypothetical protein
MILFFLCNETYDVINSYVVLFYEGLEKILCKFNEQFLIRLKLFLPLFTTLMDKLTRKKSC